MAKKKYFIPKELKNEEGIIGFSELSGRYFKSAKELIEKAKNQNEQFSPNVFAAIILFFTTLESYFNECLTLSSMKTEDEQIINKIIQLKCGRQSYIDKFQDIFKAYDPNGNGIATNSEVYHNLMALIKLRNELVHYNPKVENSINYPTTLQSVFERSKSDLVNARWITNLSNVKIGDWAYETTKNTIYEFVKISGFFNPIDSDKENNFIGWE